MEHLNTRYAYNTVLARRWYTSLYAPGAAVNFATHALYNSATISKLIVVKAATVTGFPTTARPRIGLLHGTLGANLGLVTPLFAGEPAPNGQHFYVDAAALSADMLMQIPLSNVVVTSCTNNMLCVLPPGWSLYIGTPTIAQTVAVGFWWEELDIGDPQLGSLQANW